MKLACLPILALFACALTFQSCQTRAAETDLNAPLPVDPNVKIGTLPNGMTYWIRQHKTPPGKVAMYLHIGSGSINERDEQQGLAHYLEHMAFNGSQNFAPGTLVKFFESLGLTFGAHQNAFTSFDQTTYILSLPDTKVETLDKGLVFLADVGFRMTLPDVEIDKERGVILEEARSRKGPQQRMTEKLLPLLLPGSVVPDRLPIGKEEIIKIVKKPLFSDYYGSFYRPDNTTLMVVGDMDPAVVEARIVEQFKDWKKVDAAKADVNPGIKPYSESRAGIITDPEETEAEVSAQTVREMRTIKTLGDYRRQLVENLGTAILNRRLDALVKAGSAPYQGAHLGVSPFLNVCTYINAQASGKPDQWEAMLRALLTEIKRGRDHGFLPDELELVKRSQLAWAEQAARTESTQDARNFLGRMNTSVSQKMKPVAAAQSLEMIKSVLPGITAAEVTDAFKQNFSSDARLILVTMPEKEGMKIPSKEDILKVAAEVEGKQVAALEAKARPKNLLDQEPKPGTVTKTDRDPDLDIVSITLSNGARVHLRSMDFKKNQVSMRISFGGGELLETEGNKGVSDVAALAWGNPSTKKYDSTTIRDLMTGKTVGVGGGSDNDSLTLSVSGSPQDLEDGLKLAYLLATEPKVEEASVKKWREEATQYYESRKTSIDAHLSERLNSILSGNDVRFKPMEMSQINARNVPEAQAWLEKTVLDGPIEAVIVGDMNRDEMMRLALLYIGSLPARKTKIKDLDKYREIEIPKGPNSVVEEIDTITNKSEVIVGWRGADWKDVKERRLLQIAAKIMEVRLREEIRENRALTYSISCHAAPSDAYPGTGMVQCYFTADPKKAEEAAKLSRQIMEKFAEEGPTEKEMETAHKQFQNEIETRLKEPAYWMSVLADLDTKGTKLKDVKELLEKMTTYTGEEVWKNFKKYAKDERFIQVISRPITRKIALTRSLPPQVVPVSLKSVPLFERLNEELLSQTAKAMQVKSFKDGETIVKEGDAGDSFFVLASGDVVVEKNGADGKVTPLSQLSEGEFFGEIALLKNSPRSASVRAKGNVTCLILAAKDFQSLLTSNPAVREELEKAVKERTSQKN